jgi:hypothetical protein
MIDSRLQHLASQGQVMLGFFSAIFAQHRHADQPGAVETPASNKKRIVDRADGGGLPLQHPLTLRRSQSKAPSCFLSGSGSGITRQLQWQSSAAVATKAGAQSSCPDRVSRRANHVGRFTKSLLMAVPTVISLPVSVGTVS